MRPDEFHRNLKRALVSALRRQRRSEIVRYLALGLMALGVVLLLWLTP